MYANQHDGGSNANALFSGSDFMPPQATQKTERRSSSTNLSTTEITIPLTVKQISTAYCSNNGKSDFVVDGVQPEHVMLLGRVENKSERVTDVSFSLDDGTGRVDVNRRIYNPSDTNELAIIENGMYVIVSSKLTGLQGERHISGDAVRPVQDFNRITQHFMECIHSHLDNTRVKHVGIGSTGDFCEMVLSVFREPASLAHDNGLHVDEIIRRLGLPEQKIRESIEYHVEVGNIYSTIDDFHFKSACNG